MSDPLLKSEIHAERNTGILATGYDSRIQAYITGQGTPFATGYAKNHILRDLNRKLFNHGLSSYITDSYDAGFRPTTLTGILAAGGGGGGGGGGVELLLDVYPNAYAAYSVRHLRTAYSGPCLRIREDGGDTETDIGFSDGWIDTAAIASHCGANNGYVVKWYDQSENNRDVSHATAANQPQIYNGVSVLVASNGKGLIRFDGVNDELLYIDVDAGNNDHSDYVAVNNVTWQSGIRAIWAGGHFGSGQNFIIFTAGSSSSIDLKVYFQGTTRTFSTGGAENTEWLISLRRNYSAATVQMIVNNSSETVMSSIGSARHEGVLLGRRFNYGSSHTTIDIQEFIRWNTDHTDEDDTSIRANQNSAFTYYE